MKGQYAQVGIAVWLALFGIWPIAHPAHSIDDPMAGIDLLLHLAGAGYLISLWAGRRAT